MIAGKACHFTVGGPIEHAIRDITAYAFQPQRNRCYCKIRTAA